MTAVPSPSPGDASQEAVRGWCERAGMRPDSPLRAALLATFEAAAAAREAAGGARGLTPDGERELVRRVAEAAAAGAERGVGRLSRRIELRTGLALALAGAALFAGGYALGRRDGGGRMEGPASAAFVAGIAELNDVGALRRHCERTGYEQTGRRACDLPPVWISTPAAATARR